MRRRIRWQILAGYAALLLVLTIVSHATRSQPASTPGTGTASHPAASHTIAAAAPVRPAAAAGTVTRAAGVPAAAAAAADRTERSSTRALTVLAQLQVKGRAPMTGYSRAQFGQSWTDDNDDPGGRNGCDIRNDILRRDLTHVAVKPGTGGCVVASGVLRDPYTGQRVTFRRGPLSDTVQIDHVTALADDWQTGAQQLTATQRVDLANDPLELLAVNGATNQAKGDADAASWLPPAHGYRCFYVARQIAVKHAYHLWLTLAEHDAMTRVLHDCPTQTVPAETGAPRITLPTHRRTPASAARSSITHQTKPTPAATSAAATTSRAAAASRVAASSETPTAGCTTTSTGHCIRGCEFCPESSQGETGTDAAGRAYVCRDPGYGRPHWETP